MLSPIRILDLLHTLQAIFVYTSGQASSSQGDRPLDAHDNPFLSSKLAEASSHCLLTLWSWPIGQPVRLTYGLMDRVVLGLEIYNMQQLNLPLYSMAFDVEHEELGVIGTGALGRMGS